MAILPVVSFITGVDSVKGKNTGLISAMVNSMPGSMSSICFNSSWLDRNNLTRLTFFKASSLLQAGRSC